MRLTAAETVGQMTLFIEKTGRPSRLQGFRPNGLG